MGDPSKNLFLTEVLNVIRTENLLDVVTRSGAALLNGLYELQVLIQFVCKDRNTLIDLFGRQCLSCHRAIVSCEPVLCLVFQARHPGVLSRARGQGTFCAIDVCDDATRNKILLKARDRGTGSTSSHQYFVVVGVSVHQVLRVLCSAVRVNVDALNGK